MPFFDHTSSLSPRTTPKWKPPAYENEADEIGQTTPSTETRPLFAVAFLDLTLGPIPPLRIDHLHAACAEHKAKPAKPNFMRVFGCSACRAQARVDFVIWNELQFKGHGVHYRILDVAEAVGYIAKDDHGDYLAC